MFNHSSNSMNEIISLFLDIMNSYLWIVQSSKIVAGEHSIEFEKIFSTLLEEKYGHSVSTSGSHYTMIKQLSVGQNQVVHTWLNLILSFTKYAYPYLNQS